MESKCRRRFVTFNHHSGLDYNCICFFSGDRRTAPGIWRRSLLSVCQREVFCDVLYELNDPHIFLPLFSRRIGYSFRKTVSHYIDLPESACSDTEQHVFQEVDLPTTPFFPTTKPMRSPFFESIVEPFRDLSGRPKALFTFSVPDRTPHAGHFYLSFRFFFFMRLAALSCTS